MPRQKRRSAYSSRPRRKPVAAYRSRLSRPLFEGLEDRLALAALVYTVPAGNGTDNLTLRLAGAQLQLFDNSVLVANPLLANTTAVAITGAANENDVLTVDFGGGLFSLPKGILFNGGAAGSDFLRVLGGTFTTVSYTVTGPQSGTVQLDTLLITDSNLEGIDADTSRATIRVFTSGISGAQNIRLRDDGSPVNGMSAIDSNSTGAFAPINFRSPTSSLTVNAGDGDDTVTTLSLDSNFNATVILNGEGGNDTLTGNSRDNRLAGGADNDTLIGGAGNDTYLFDADVALGSDTLNEAGGGTDTLDFAATTTLGVSVNLANPVAQPVNGNLMLTLSAGNTFENVTGSSQADTFSGNSLDNSLRGNAGNDTYLFDADVALGRDTLNEAGGGIDTLDFAASTTLGGVSVDLSGLTHFVNDNLNLILLGAFENAVGGSGDDELYGNSLDNRLTGGPGRDVLIGNAGNDTYLFDADGALGNDLLSERAGEGIDTLDFAATTTLGVKVSLGPHAQNVNGNLILTLSQFLGDAFENVTGGALNDTLTGNSLDNTLTGGPGDDTYLFDADGALGRDTLNEAGGGIDTLDFAATTTLGVNVNLANPAAQTVNGNLILTLSAGNTVENVVGGSGSNTLRGNSLDNRLTGGPGRDTYLFDTDSPLGTDTVLERTSGTITLGRVIDTLDFSLTTTMGVIVDLSTPSVQVVNVNLRLSLIIPGNGLIEDVVGGSLGDRLTGNGADNTLTGGPGDDTLIGAAGHDTYLFDADGALGSDTLDESVGGIDTLDFAATSTLFVVVNLAESSPQRVNNNLNLILLGAFENAVGGSADDVLFGNALDNSLTGGPGDDALFGRAGDDTYLFDTDGALGSDTLNEGGGGIDTVDFAATTTLDVSVNLQNVLSHAVNDNLNLILLGAFENAVGGSGNDTLSGSVLDNRLSGGPGNDTLIGGPGNDTLIGGAGNDTYLFDADSGALGSDTLNEAVGGIDTLDFAATTTLGVNVNLADSAAQRVNGNLILTLLALFVDAFENVTGGALNDTLTGNSLDNTLSGGPGNDTLVGNDGADTLNGGDGADTLLGGRGNDVLVPGNGPGDILDGGPDQDGIAFYGTAGNDRIRVSWQAGPQAVVRMNGQTFVYDYANGETIFVFAGAGNDDVVMDQSAGLRWRAEFHGEGGNDHLVGSLMDDLLFGGMGFDHLQGGLGNDRLDGGAGFDVFDGGAGADSIFADDDALDIIFADAADLLVDIDPFDLVLGRRPPSPFSFFEEWWTDEFWAGPLGELRTAPRELAQLNR